MKANTSIGKSGIFEIKENDLEMILEWRNSDRVRNMMRSTKIITLEEHKAYYGKLLKEKPARHLLYYYDDMPAGVITASFIDKEKGYMDAGYYLGVTGLPLSASFGIVYCALDYVFETFGAKKICGLVRKDNKGSISINKRFGYQITEKDEDDELRNEFYNSFMGYDTWQKNKERIGKTL